MLVLFTATALVSAALLFLLEPMFARMVLPLLGGSPAVWNTALVFYQTTLLAGYAYAHLASTRLGVRRHAWLHVAVALAAFTCLPIAVPRGWSPPVASDPVPWMLALLAVAIGLPFFVLSATGPLVQKWFAATGHPAARDPYFLYAASNAGSMAGLLAYPLLLEPSSSLRTQSTLWTAGFTFLAALFAACAWSVWRAAPAPARRGTALRPLGADVLAQPHAAPHAVAAASPPIAWGRRARWALLAFVPSSLMLGVTNHISTDIAAIPLLWVVPLALYLLSLIVVFARRPVVPHATAVRALPLFVLPLVIILEVRAVQPLALIIGLHLLVLFVAALVCHGELANDRPSADRLTEFYLWMALGGALGGAFNALLAPLVFRGVAEYPIAIVLACLLRPTPRPASAPSRPALTRTLDLALPALLGAAVFATVRVPEWLGHPLAPPSIVFVLAFAMFPLFAFARRSFRFALGLTAVLLVNPAGMAERSRLLFQERDFFGVNRVGLDPSRRFVQLYHGTTLHGLQRVAPRSCHEPLGYYHREGPLGDAFHALREGGGGTRSVAVAGLGAGGTAAYAQPGERWTFFEIDPAVRRIATDSTLFCYLSDAGAHVNVVLGDARRSLAASRDTFDLVLLDAYTSDAIPVHLITREALRVYLAHLAPRGLLLFHVSNRYFDLVPVVARLAQDAGLACRERNQTRLTDAQIENERLAPSTYVAVARTAADLGALAHDPNWTEPRVRAGLRLWTDDYSSLLSVLRR